MDGIGIAVFVVGLILFFATKKKYPVFLFASGVGAGILIGAIWAMSIVNNILR